MKTNGRIRELLAAPSYNDIEYGHRVIWPLLGYLGIPPEARRPQFHIASFAAPSNWPARTEEGFVCWWSLKVSWRGTTAACQRSALLWPGSANCAWSSPS